MSCNFVGSRGLYILAKVAMDPIDADASLMLSFRDGNEAAFEQLLDKYHRIIVNFAYKFVNNRAEAEELAQEVFLKVYRSRERYEPRARFAAWIFKIATNVSLKALRHRRGAPPVSLDAGPEGNTAWRLDPPDLRASPERSLAREEVGVIVRRAVGSLPVRERTALLLRRYEDLSYREIAGIMGCSEAAIKTYLHRGKGRLRRLLLPHVKGGV